MTSFLRFCEYFWLIVVTYLDCHPNPLLGSLPGGQQRTLKIRTFSKWEMARLLLTGGEISVLDEGQ